MYGLPISRQFEMNDRYDLISVIENFDDCPLHQRYILASNIKKAFGLFNVDKQIEVLESNSIINFLNDKYITIKEEQNVIKEKNNNEFEIMNFKRDLMDELYNLFGITSGNSIVKESYDAFIYSHDKLDEFFNENDIDTISKRLYTLKTKYNLNTELDDIDLFKLKKNLSDNNDSVYFPSSKTFMGNYAYINDTLYLMSKKTDNINEYMLIPLDRFWDNKGMKVIIENNNVNINIDDLLKRLS